MSSDRVGPGLKVSARPIDSAAALGWHVGPISAPDCDRTTAQARWGRVYRQTIISHGPLNKYLSRGP